MVLLYLHLLRNPTIMFDMTLALGVYYGTSVMFYDQMMDTLFL